MLSHILAPHVMWEANTLAKIIVFSQKVHLMMAGFSLRKPYTVAGNTMYICCQKFNTEDSQHKSWRRRIFPFIHPILPCVFPCLTPSSRCFFFHSIFLSFIRSFTFSFSDLFPSILHCYVLDLLRYFLFLIY